MADESLLQQQADAWVKVAQTCEQKLARAQELRQRLEESWSGQAAQQQCAELDRMGRALRQASEAARENASAWQRVCDTAAWARAEIAQVLQEWHQARQLAVAEHQRQVKQANDELRQWINTPVQLWRPKEPDLTALWNPYAGRISDIAARAAAIYDESRTRLKHPPRYDPPPAVGAEPAIAAIVVPKRNDQPRTATQQATAEIPIEASAPEVSRAKQSSAERTGPKRGVPAVLGRTSRRTP
ncbi:hypothetical protein [Natronoglycomyces albus]|uniref:Uncharacterized protein n=1 Tax=Natronoglycomyces albus TaxID=2811108 RepID=A0A895XHN5_9ACTN|nr:hypothetical protein [Natronoglycomyces albus]QSB04854.1 hypothetical protein JQS30_13960 [Natronoglycomyces albus]